MSFENQYEKPETFAETEITVVEERVDITLNIDGEDDNLSAESVVSAEVEIDVENRLEIEVSGESEGENSSENDSDAADENGSAVSDVEPLGVEKRQEEDERDADYRTMNVGEVSHDDEHGVLEHGRGCRFFRTDDGEPIVEPCPGCYKLHETDWLAEYPDTVPSDIVEVRFKNTRRSYYRNVNNLPLQAGDLVAVEASPGHDIGTVSLTGDMVARQIRRTGFRPQNGEYKKVYRKAKNYDIERWQEAIALEHETMIRSRQIAAEMGLDMKIGDVEYQGDKTKAIFYYIAEGRVDFRELIKVFAEQFRIRIEMKQIGARQEAGRIGGIGPCGRELCCASWMSSFSSVTTNAARVQDLSLNPQKLAGQCSKLKCCMMHEYDVYADARREMPRLREPLQTIDGEWFLVKSDILAHTMTFSTAKDALVNPVTLPVWRVREILAANRAGQKVETLLGDAVPEADDEPSFRNEEDSITRFDSKRRSRNRNRRKGGNNGGSHSNSHGDNHRGDAPTAGDGRNGNRRHGRGFHQRPNGNRRNPDSGGNNGGDKH